MYTQRFSSSATHGPAISVRERRVQLLRGLMVTAARPRWTCEYALQVIDLTQGWSNAVAERITHTDLLAVVAAVHIFVKLRYTPWQRYLHCLPQLLEGFTAQLLRRSPCAVPTRRGEHIIQQIVHQEFSLLQQLGYEVAILMPREWTNKCQLQCALRQQLQFRIKSNHSWRAEVQTQQLWLLFIGSSPCRLMPIESHFRSKPSRYGSLVRVSPCLELAQLRG